MLVRFLSGCRLTRTSRSFGGPASIRGLGIRYSRLVIDREDRPERGECGPLRRMCCRNELYWIRRGFAEQVFVRAGP